MIFNFFKNMPEKTDQTERLPLIGTAGIGDSLIITQLAQIRELSDREILEAMAARLEGTPSVVDAISGLVAQQVLNQGLEDGAPLVAPTASLIMRNAHGEYGLNDEAYARLKGLPRTELGRCVAQGDYGIHAAVGLEANRGQLKLHNPGDLLLKHGGKALVGYERALQLADEPAPHDRSLAMTVKTTVPTLRDRLEEVVKIVRGLFRVKTLREILTDDHNTGLIH